MRHDQSTLKLMRAYVSMHVFVHIQLIYFETLLLLTFATKKQFRIHFNKINPKTVELNTV